MIGSMKYLEHSSKKKGVQTRNKGHCYYLYIYKTIHYEINTVCFYDLELCSFHVLQTEQKKKGSSLVLFLCLKTNLSDNSSFMTKAHRSL